MKEMIIQRENETLQLERWESGETRTLSIFVFYHTSDQLSASFRHTSMTEKEINYFAVNSECTELMEGNGGTKAPTSSLPLQGYHFKAYHSIIKSYSTQIPNYG